ncbi:DUF1049 domain-containing protein [Pseudonocardiaceae bacterium YIM PH 21723]|nr:DUF1049 domain-containing protein [Pseudonocardiaceae bacterium YIM PH 21723]
MAEPTVPVTPDKDYRDYKDLSDQDEREQAREVKHTRTAGVWAAAITGTLLLILLLVFILQNQTQVTVTFLAWEGQLPVAVAMLFSATAGALLIALIGAARIMQLRRTARRNFKAAAVKP